MANYVIGDLQGCFDELIALIAKFQFNPEIDRIYLVCDLVNRGPKSLQVLQWAYEHRTYVHAVLGNHDLHLLACWLSVVKPKRGDTIDEILSCTNVDELLQWLRSQPLMRMVDGACVVHAGIYPGWTIEQAQQHAVFAHSKYAGKDYRQWFEVMYGNKPLRWSEQLSELEQFRFTINAFTRMRFCNDLDLDLKFKGELLDAPANLQPWFRSPAAASASGPIVFGHWSALGLLLEQNVVALDTGCVWGGQLTAIRLEDRAIFQVAALSPYQNIEK